MIRDIIERNNNINPKEKEIAILKENFPSCFSKDGSFDIVKFQELLQDNIDITKEGYELKFLGKNYSKMLSSLDTETVIVPNYDYNELDENKNSENLFITGDNLDGLKHLLKSYSGQIKCIYIDPPYNTGSDGFVYNDKFDFTLSDLIEKLSIDESQAQRILDLTKRESSSHSAWLMFMYPRLELARGLLADDGLIFVSIDDNEQANAKLLMDEIFGEENFLTCISRATGTPTGGGFDGLVNELDYILIYSKNISSAIIRGLEMTEDDAEIYNQIDANGNRYLTRSLRRTGGEDRREDRPTMFYPMISPDGTEIYPLGPTGYESRWICSPETAAQLEKDNLIEWKKTNRDGELVWHPYQKFYLENRTKTPGNVWKEFFVPEEYQSALWDDTEGNKKATRDIRTLFDNKKVFETSKPIGLIEKIISIGSDKDDTILDFFSGSATTAHAIMRSNIEKKSKRKYILIQLDEETKEGSEARKFGFKTIDEMGRDRIVRAANTLKDKYPNNKSDLGFKHYFLKDIKQNTLDKIEKFNNDSFLTDSSIYDELGSQTILTTWLVHDNYGFNSNYELILFDNYQAYWCNNHLYLINPHLSENAIKAIIEKYNNDGDFNPQNIVMFGYNFNFTEMENLKTNIKILKDSEKNLKVNIDVRY